ncbi:hypothetical protein CLU79DRAFT_836754 [Phycomyces nitens]|nr:hypothetical protein CLU79DRAFT_836754 [Phycomyces nitens]
MSVPIHKPTHSVRIGCYSAFWGDSPAAARQLVQTDGLPLNYLVADYLAEITMGILAARRQRRLLTTSPSKATDYIAEFIDLVLHPILPNLVSNRTRVVTNAGGLDPIQCKHAIEALLAKLNINLTVAAVVGDDVLATTSVPCLASVPIQSFSAIPSPTTLDADRLPAPEQPIVSLNAYLGARAIASALDAGADIVVTGRVVDSALVVGPLIHEYGWSADQPDYLDKLATASLAGHIIECGCHATGGNFTDWRLAADSPYGGYANMGYPIVEFDSNGTYFVVTKPAKTGGLVTPATVSEQILYETLDPALYLLPDVILDIRQVTVSQVRPDRVLVRGAKGRPPTPWLKCSGIFMDGWKISGELLIAGQEAKEKALAVGQAIQQRSLDLFKQLGIKDFRGFNIEALGSEHLFGPSASSNPAREVMLRLTAHHDNPKALQIFAMEMSPSATCMAPGITGSASGRPKPIPNLVHFPCLIPKTFITTSHVVGKASPQSVTWGTWEASPFETPAIPATPDPPVLDTVKVKLIDVAYARSGDKGNVSNIGIIARDPRFLPFIKRSVTEEVMTGYMRHLCKGSVTRFELPGLHALNFVLTNSLGGGGLSSLSIDRQGKTYAQLVLDGLEVQVPRSLIVNGSKL